MAAKDSKHPTQRLDDDPAQVLAYGHQLVIELQARLRELEARWSDPGAVRARLDELSGRAVEYAAVAITLAAVHVGVISAVT